MGKPIVSPSTSPPPAGSDGETTNSINSEDLREEEAGEEEDHTVPMDEIAPSTTLDPQPSPQDDGRATTTDDDQDGGAASSVATSTGSVRKEEDRGEATEEEEGAAAVASSSSSSRIRSARPDQVQRGARDVDASVTQHPPIKMEENVEQSANEVKGPIRMEGVTDDEEGGDQPEPLKMGEDMRTRATQSESEGVDVDDPSTTSQSSEEAEQGVEEELDSLLDDIQTAPSSDTFVVKEEEEDEDEATDGVLESVGPQRRDDGESGSGNAETTDAAASSTEEIPRLQRQQPQQAVTSSSSSQQVVVQQDILPPVPSVNLQPRGQQVQTAMAPNLGPPEQQQLQQLQTQPQPHPVLVPVGGAAASPARQMQQMQVVTHPDNGGSIPASIPIVPYESQGSFLSAAAPPSAPPVRGRRSIRLRLVEETSAPPPPAAPVAGPAAASSGRASFLDKIRRNRSKSMTDVYGGGAAPPGGAGGPELRHSADSNVSAASSTTSTVIQTDRGTISVSWYDGTGTSDLQSHVERSVVRTLRLGKEDVLRDVRIIDESVVPNEEIVLCPYIPDGSQFLLKFTIQNESAAALASQRSFHVMESFISEGAPDSPSAAPSPHPSSLDLVQLRSILSASGLLPAAAAAPAPGAASALVPGAELTPRRQQQKRVLTSVADAPPLPSFDETGKAAGAAAADIARTAAEGNATAAASAAAGETKAVSFEHQTSRESGDGKNGNESSGQQPDEVQEALRQLNELLLGRDDVADGRRKHRHHRHRSDRHRSEEQRQVVFVLANYFVLFLSLIAISAEVHERAPRWMEWVTTHVDSVQSCSRDADALYGCVLQGNFSGLVASFVFWITRSAATKNILLFGFDSTQKLWTVVYEALVTAVCWGTSYIFIRRGLNPDTRTNFLHKYWKDAVYGSLAGFNAYFLKAVLKNLIPQDQVLDAFETRQLRVVDWVSQLFRSQDHGDF